MHEFSIAAGIIEIACEEARKAHADHVRSVTCRAGVLRQVDPELLHDAFALAAEDTPCAGAELSIEQMPVHLACPDCGHRFSAHGWDWQCPKCGQDATCLEGGDELDVTSVEVDSEATGAQAKGGLTWSAS